MPTRPIVLSGFMATGKTTVGRALSERLAVPFVDTDAVLVARHGAPIATQWSRDGEAVFRAKEADLVRELLADASTRVIAFGGGTVTRRDVRRLAVANAFVVTLEAAPDVVVARAGDLASRPNLAAADPVERARELVAARKDAYAECHLTLATDSLEVDETVEAIALAAERDPLLVPLGTRSYVIDVGVDAPHLLTDAVARLAPSSVLLVTDGNVQRARGAVFVKALSPLAFGGSRVVLPAGEEHKTFATVGTIWDAALGAGIDRDALVVAAGGGVVGDLAGFAASTLLRGVRFVTAPTTLLAMVDASVGGKTGFDHAMGKNLVGSFHQPSAVVVDVAHLRTLPARDRTAGLAEVVKMGLTHDADLFETVEDAADRLRDGDEGAIARIVRRALAAKIRVVQDDERESGPRMVLNFGHTLGHALESGGHFTKFRHGEAVALGMLAELDFTTRSGWTDPTLGPRVRTLLERLGLPSRATDMDRHAAIPHLGSDKKRTGASVRMPIVTDVGVCRLERVDLATLATTLQ
ncbi:MAG: 3-dehydroquinate synthase [Polyangiaceae bacterium]